MKYSEIVERQLPFSFKDHCLLWAYRGSIAHGTYIPPEELNSTDDQDLFGVVFKPLDYILGLKNFEHTEYIEGGLDILVYEFEKFFRLLLKSNPNVLSVLFLSDDKVLYRHPVWDSLISYRHLFMSKEIYHTFRGYVYAQLKKAHCGYTGHLGEKRKQIVEKYGYDCYEEATTEFLTDVGWKKFDGIDDSMQLATLNIKSGALEFQHYTDKIDQTYDGFMYQIDTINSRAIVTPNHKLLLSDAHRNLNNNFSVVYDKENTNWRLLSLNDMWKYWRGHFYIRIVPNRQLDEYNISDDYIRLIGLYLSDGTSQMRANGQFQCIRFTQTKNDEYRDMINNLMDRFSIRRYDYVKETVWLLHGKIPKQIFEDCGCNRRDGSNHKHLPRWCFHLSARQVMLLWDAWMAGDGTKKMQNDTIYTTCKCLADDLQAAMIMAGVPCVVYGGYKRHTNLGDVVYYHIMKSNITNGFYCFRKNNFLAHNDSKKGDKRGYNIKEKLVEGCRIVCFEVPNGTLITRNAGRPAIHGNSKNAQHMIRLLRQGVEALTTGEIVVVRPDAQELKDIKQGKWSYDQFTDVSQQLITELDQAFQSSVLPDKQDYNQIESLFVTLRRQLYMTKGEA